MRSNLNWFGALALVAAISCGKRVKPADEQELGQLRIPAADLSADALALGKTQAYKGSAVIFAADATPEQIGRIAEAAKSSRRAKADWVGFKREQVDPLAGRWLTLNQELRDTEAKARADQSSRTAREAAARTWIDDRWAALGQAKVLKNDDHQSAAKAVFARYCEAKIWELAVSPLSFASYTRRPSPLILCEATYEARGLLQGEACQPSSTGKSFFACLWKEGVLKTSFFVGRYENAFDQSPSEKKGDKLKTWVDDGTLQSVLASDKAPKLVNAALYQDRLRVGSVLGATYKDAFVPDAGTPAETPELALVDASPDMLQRAVEDGQKPTTPAALLFARAGELDAAGLVALKALHEDLQAMARRDSLQASASDFLFNHPVETLPEPASVTTAKARDSFQAIFGAIAPEFKERLAALEADLTTTAAAQMQATAEANARFDAYTNALLKGAIAASEDGATTALWISVKLELSKPADGILKVAFQLDEVGATVAEACVTADTKQEVDCPPRARGDDRPYVVGHVEHDAATGLLAFEMTLGRPEPLGFTLTAPPEPGSGNPFSLIDPATLRDSRLRLELYPARDQGTLEFYSGKFLIKGPNELGKTAVLHEGATNLLAD